MMEEEGDFWSRLSPAEGAFLIVGLGLLIFIGAILNWDWVLEGDGHLFNIAWVSHVFGRTVARVIMGVLGLLLAAGGVWCYFLWK